MGLIIYFAGALITILLRCQQSSQLQCYMSLNGKAYQAVTCENKDSHTVQALQLGAKGSLTTVQPSETSSPHHSDTGSGTMQDFQHCLILQSFDAQKQDESGCDFHRICDSALLQESVVQLVNYNATKAYLYCCNADRCNDESKGKEIESARRKWECLEDGYKGSEMIVTKRLASHPHFPDILVYSCEDPDFCRKNQLSTNQCRNITDENDTMIESCCCDSLSSSPRSTSPTASTILPTTSPPQPGLPSTRLAPMPTNSEQDDHAHWKFVAGIVSAMALALLCLLGVGIIIKKYRTYRSSVSYSYNQLTADFAEESAEKDESMIIG